jgi:hypothetical protein
MRERPADGMVSVRPTAGSGEVSRPAQLRNFYVACPRLEARALRAGQVPYASLALLGRPTNRVGRRLVRPTRLMTRFGHQTHQRPALSQGEPKLSQHRRNAAIAEGASP